MAPLSRTPPGDKSRAIIAPRRLRDAEMRTSRRSELLKRTFVERAREKLDDRWWSMKVTGKIFAGPKPFAKSRRLLALARELGKNQNMCDYRSSGVKGLFNIY